MTSEWDGTPWGGAVVTEKAATGIGVGFYSNAAPLQSMARTPQELMKRAQIAYHVNPWVGTAESVVTRKVVGLAWHLEDGNDEEYEAPYPADVAQAMQLIERPQLLAPRGRPGTSTRRLMWSLTSRHLGLCGMSYWYADAMDTRGIPTSWLYINPARMWPAEDAAGNVTGWVLDAQDAQGRGGTPLELAEVLPFYLDPPDWGNYGTGLYERAMQKAQLGTLADVHGGYVLATGGRLPGIFSPKSGTIPDETFKSMVREFRQVNETPDAAKRTTVLQGPMDFTPTAADPQALDLVNLAKMNRDDIFTIWGVPNSQAGVETPAGLNSGDTKTADEAVLMQGAVHDRVVAIRETLQYGWLDKYLPTVVELEIEEPEFDDETPAYDRLAKTRDTALTNAQRWEIIGVPPTGDPAIDNAILLPSTVVLWATAPDGSAPGTIEGKEELTVGGQEEGKASAPKEFLGLRKSLDQRVVPATKQAVIATLEAQRKNVVAWIRSHEAHLRSKPGDMTWWNEGKEDERLLAAIRPHVAGVSESVTSRAKEVLGGGKADPFDERVQAQVLSSVGKRIKGINQTTRDKVAAAIAQGFDEGLSVLEIAALIENAAWFGPDRAEVIARTETAFAYNAAALDSYREFDITQVEAIDGDQDEECLARLEHGPYDIEEAMAIEDHPNGTLDWLPVIGKAYTAPVGAAPTLPLPAAPTQPLNIHVHDGKALMLRTVIDRGPDGKIVGTHEEPISAA